MHYARLAPCAGLLPCGGFVGYVVGGVHSRFGAFAAGMEFPWKGQNPDAKVRFISA